MSISKAADYLGVSKWKLRQLDTEGKLKPFRSDGNTRYYSQEQLDDFLGILRQKPERIVIGYCRVSSKKQSDDMDKQVESVKSYLVSQGKPFKIIQDIGSGINYSNQGLQQLIKLITDGKVEKVVCLYKDRLLRFGIELLEYVASLYGTTIEVIDSTPKTEQKELVEDLVQIITVFSCELQGKRSHKARKVLGELVQDLKGAVETNPDTSTTAEGELSTMPTG
ncbi:MAG: IS607 family transposase [Clostridiales bacterium]|nr:IS607 family transposase [Clostridiales bacterium]